MDFTNGPVKKPDSTKLIDDNGRLRSEWSDFFGDMADKLNSVAGTDPSSLLVGAAPARETAEHLVANTSTINWDLSTAGQPKPFIPDNGVGTDQIAPDAVVTASIADKSITDAKLRDSSPLSVIGRSVNSTGSPADISAAANSNTVLQESGGTLVWGPVGTAFIPDNSITNAKLADMADSTIKGRASGAGTGDPQDLTGTQVVAILPSATTAVNGVVMLATDAEIQQSAAGSNVIAASALASAAAIVTLTDAATIAVDWSTFINGIVTVTANRALGNPTNGQPGEWRTIQIIGNSASARTITFGGQYQGNVPTITDVTSSKAYLFSILCLTSTSFMIKSTQSLP